MVYAQQDKFMKQNTAVQMEYYVKLMVQRLKELNKYSGFLKRDCRV